jgi:hypothetical protein
MHISMSREEEQQYKELTAASSWLRVFLLLLRAS